MHESRKGWTASQLKRYRKRQEVLDTVIEALARAREIFEAPTDKKVALLVIKRIEAAGFEIRRKGKGDR